MQIKYVDKLIIGAGLYGMYSALYCCEHDQKVAVIECDSRPFMRATYINQARVHQGYHYPRSLSTALKSAGYFERFNQDFSFCINKEFDQIYATSSAYSWTNGNQFKAFCDAANIPCEELNPNNYFKTGMCDQAFRTREYTYDAMILRDYYVDKLSNYSNIIDIFYGEQIKTLEKRYDRYYVETDKYAFETPFVLNATYAGVNQMLNLVGADTFNIKYELCEIILCNTNNELQNIGFTIMDGPFFSIMPFGKTGLHSLTSVTFTPHATSYEAVPSFSCQQAVNGYCDETHLGNCNSCLHKPDSAFPYMSNLARKYMLDKYGFAYKESLFSMKPILMNSEIDDSRPTVIKITGKSPTFVSVLSGKINTVYDLDEVLSDGQ